MTDINFYFRHPGNIYFSIEKLFRSIAKTINEEHSSKFKVALLNLPYHSGIYNLRKNIAFTRKTQTRINHITGDTHYAILGCSNKNINVLTVHDCVMLRKLKRTNPKFWIIKWLWYDLPVRKADMVTVISENSKKELIFFTGCAEDRIRVIHNFPDDRFQYVSFQFNKAQPNILFIGTAENKNLDRLILALKGISATLHIVGNPGSRQMELLEQNNISYKLSSGLSDEEMQNAYAKSDLLAFASTYEGFGLPIMEAQLTGRPVLTSNLSPMKEVAGEGAVLVDPTNVQSIRDGILKIIHDDAYREQIIRAGFESVKRFNLDSVADQYTHLYDELLKTKSVINN